MIVPLIAAALFCAGIQSKKDDVACCVKLLRHIDALTLESELVDDSAPHLRVTNEDLLNIVKVTLFSKHVLFSVGETGPLRSVKSVLKRNVAVVSLKFTMVSGGGSNIACAFTGDLGSVGFLYVPYNKTVSDETYMDLLCPVSLYQTGYLCTGNAQEIETKMRSLTHQFADTIVTMWIASHPKK